MSSMGAVFKEESIVWKGKTIKMDFPTLGVEKIMRAWLMDRGRNDIEDQFSRHKNERSYREDLGAFRLTASAGKYDFWGQASMTALVDCSEFLVEFCFRCAQQVKGQENITIEEVWNICRDKEAVQADGAWKWRYGRAELFDAVDRLLLPDPPIPPPTTEAGANP